MMRRRHVQPASIGLGDRGRADGSRRAVVVGIDAHPTAPLGNAVHDARAVARNLERDYGFTCLLLTDRMASASAIRAGFRQGVAEAGPAGQFLFYFAGHGEHGASEARGGALVLASDAGATSLDISWLAAQILRSRCAQNLLILDTCYSGHALFGPENLDDRPSVDRRVNRCVRQVLCSGSPYQRVLDGEPSEHSPFTRSLLAALTGHAGIHEDHGTLHFEQLLPFMKQAPDPATGAAQGSAPSQYAIGGNLTGTTSRYGFTFCPVVPRVPGDVVRRCRDAEPEERIRGLHKLARACRREPGRLSMALDLSAPFPIGGGHEVRRPRRERLELVATHRAFLDLLASDPLDRATHDRCEATLAARLLCSCLREDAPDVRHRARLALRRVAKRTGARLRLVLAHRLWRSDPVQRRRAWETLAMLPRARSRLRPLRRIRGHFTAVRLWGAFLWRTLTATRRRRIAMATPPTALAALSLGLGTTYYMSLSTLDGTSVTLRSGVPGLVALPGVGVPLVGTDFTTGDLEDPRSVAMERPRGSWLPSAPHGLLGRDGLINRLKPTRAALARWRLGDPADALELLHGAIESGDAQAPGAIGYLALQAPEHLDSAIDGLVVALASEGAVRTGARSAIEVLRVTHEPRLPPIRARLADELIGAGPRRRIALLEALDLLGPPSEGELDDPTDPLLLILGSTADPAVRARLAEIIARSIGPGTVLAQDRLTAVAAAIGDGPQSVRDHLFPLLAHSASDDPRAAQELDRLAPDLLARTADPGERLAIVRALPSGATRSRTIRELTRSVTAEALRTAAGPSLLDAIRTHLHLPDDTHPPGEVTAPLAEMVSGSGETEIRSDALELVRRHPPAMLREPLLGSLLDATSRGTTTIRGQALSIVVDLALDDRVDAQVLAPLLPDLLADPGFTARWEAVAAIVLLGDRIDHPGVDRWRAEAVRSILRSFTSGDPFDERFLADLPVRLARATRAARVRFLRDLVPNAVDEDPWARIGLGTLVHGVIRSDPKILPEVIPAFTVHFVQDHPASSYLHGVLVHLTKEESPELEETIATLDPWLEGPSAARTTGAMEVMGALAGASPRLATATASRLRPLIRALEPQVRQSAVRTLWLLAERQPTIEERVAEDLLETLRTESETTIRYACFRGLERLGPVPGLRDRVVETLVQSLEPFHPEAARALARWLPGVSSPVRRAVRAHIEGAWERGPADVRLHLARVLATVEPGDGTIPPRVLRIVDDALDSGLTGASGAAAIAATAAVAIDHPTALPAALSRLRRLLVEVDSSTGLLATVELYRLGRSSPERARHVFGVLSSVLEDPSSPNRWSVISNGLLPLAKERPELLTAATELLLRIPSPESSRQSMAVFHSARSRALTEIIARRAVHDSEPLVSLLISRRGWERRLGRRVLARVIDSHPERAVTLTRRLHGHRRSPFRHVRIGAALADETIGLVTASHSSATDGHAVERWKALLEWLPERRLHPARAAILDRLEPSVRHY